MASLIRLKQIESGSSLELAAGVGAEFEQSVIDIIQDNVAGENILRLEYKLSVMK